MVNQGTSAWCARLSPRCPTTTNLPRAIGGKSADWDAVPGMLMWPYAKSLWALTIGGWPSYSLRVSKAFSFTFMFVGCDSSFFVIHVWSHGSQMFLQCVARLTVRYAGSLLSIQYTICVLSRHVSFSDVVIENA